MNPDTKTMLELAANAAGIKGTFFDYSNNSGIQPEFANSWKPHLDDGDSARLRTTLEISVNWTEGIVEVSADMPLFLGLCEYFADHSGDKNAALRWATLRLAAEIGRRMKDD